MKESIDTDFLGVGGRTKPVQVLIQRHHLTDNGVLVKTFIPKLNEVQALVLDLLEILQSVYTEYS